MCANFRRELRKFYRGLVDKCVDVRGYLLHEHEISYINNSRIVSFSVINDRYALTDGAMCRATFSRLLQDIICSRNIDY